jgi:cell wall-associated NlpC family hydrolase
VPAPAAAAAAAAAQGGSLQTLLSYATAQVGAPYRFFSAGPETFDCSGLVVAAFRQIGMSVPHQSRALAKLGSPVDWRSGPIAAGDLVFTSSVNDPALITHVGIALDSRRWVHAVGVGRTVSIGALPSPDRIMAVQRIALP